MELVKKSQLLNGADYFACAQKINTPASVTHFVLLCLLLSEKPFSFFDAKFYRSNMPTKWE